MLAAFCLRLAAGLIAALAVLPAPIIPPRFFRVQYLTALALLTINVFFRPPMTPLQWAVLGAAAFACFVGAILWHTDEAPGGIWLNRLTWILFVAAILLGASSDSPADERWPILDHLVSAAVLGAALSSMLMGHSYLIAPAMSMSPLLRLLAMFAVALAVRIGLACYGLREWWASQSASPENETMLWLGARWLLGLAAPIVLGWMAWETARIRSTQSATGILYVVSILCFLGELLSLLLVDKTGYLL
jgi:hypothetical protein